MAYEVDAGNLLVQNFALDGSELNDDTLVGHTTDMLQGLINELFALESMECDSGKLVKLPKGKMLFPREKPLPKPKEPTRWEAFAKKKGIVKRKKMDREYDEDTKEWISTYGKKKRIHEKETEWVKSVPDGYVPKAPGGDPFLDATMERKERIDKQKKAEKSNKQRRERVESRVGAIHDAVGKVTTSSFGKFDR